MSTLRRALKTTKKGLARGLGRGPVGRLVGESSWRRDRVLILCYHGLSLVDEHEWNPSLYITQEHLERRCRVIRDLGGSVLHLDEALKRMREGTLPKRSVVFTFDDGNYDFLALAHPVLRSFGFPATVYLTTYHSLNPGPPFPVAVSYLFWKAARPGQVVEVEGIADEPVRVDLGSKSQLADAALQAMGYTWDAGYSGSQKHELLWHLAEQLGLDYDEINRQRVGHVMTVEEAARAASEGVAIELHTHRHRVPRDRALLEREIVDNRKVIEELSGRTPRHLCYPKGRAYPEVRGWLPGLGVESAAGPLSALASNRSEAYYLPRITDTGNLSEDEFAAWITGGAQFLPRRKPKRRW